MVQVGAVAVKCHGLRGLLGGPIADMLVKPCAVSQASRGLGPQCLGGPFAV